MKLNDFLNVLIHTATATTITAFIFEIVGMFI